MFKIIKRCHLSLLISYISRNIKKLHFKKKKFNSSKKINILYQKVMVKYHFTSQQIIICDKQRDQC